MKLAPDPMGTDDGTAMLEKLPGLYFAILRGTHIEREASGEIRCSFELPVIGKRTKTAPTAREAIRAVLLELTDALTQFPADQWPAVVRYVSSSTPAVDKNGSVNEEPGKVKRFKAKARQFTIGVTMPVNFKLSLQRIADQQNMSFAEAARRLIDVGFEDFDDRSYSENSQKLLSTLSSELEAWQPSDTEQVMVRLDTNVAVRLRSAAKEYRKSSSEFGAMCLSHGFELQTQLFELEQKVASSRGAPIRKLAPQVGLEAYPALLSGILAGSIRAPKKVQRRLSEVFGATERSLVEFFNRSFDHRLVPAFKAENEKPQVKRSATAWVDAVNSMNLPLDQAEKLLELDE
jgi:hypothetical protein